MTLAAFVNVVEEQGWGSAFFAVPTMVTFYVGVEWLRKRWEVKVKSRGRSKDG
jgi:hypothetical protein